MKVKTLSYREDLNKDKVYKAVNENMAKLLTQVMSNSFDYKLANKLSFNICYTTLFLKPLTPNNSYTVPDICSGIVGLLATPTSDLIDCLSNIGMKEYIVDSLKSILHDCLIYEVCCLLKIRPVSFYAIYLYYYCSLVNKEKLELCRSVIREALDMGEITLAYERLNLFFEEEVR